MSKIQIWATPTLTNYHTFVADFTSVFFIEESPTSSIFAIFTVM